MKRDYVNETSADATFFTGVEVEHTVTEGMKTLFVVGVQPYENIIAGAEGLNCKAVYFGANQSFDPSDAADWLKWEDMIKNVLDNHDVVCTLDMDVKHVNEFNESGLDEYSNFNLMISVKVPHIKLLPYNTTIKIDDTDFDDTNPGVWCHHINDLTTPDKFTHWSKYKDDKTV